MYYSATTIDSVGKGHHCVGGATSKNILGPYSPINTTLTCPYAQGGSIDAAGFKDFEELGSGWGYDDDEEVQNFGGDCWTQPEWWGGGKGGQRYIVYKIDGNSIGHGGACGNTVSVQALP